MSTGPKKETGKFTDLFDLTDQIAVITGAGGMGRSIALALANFGAHIVMADVDLEGLDEVADQISDLNRKVLVRKVDATKPEEVDNLFKLVVDEFGRVDILVHTVGETFRKPALETTYNEWIGTVNLNLTSTFLCDKAAGKIMVEQRKGKIINISSCASFFTYPQRPAYAASKAGVNQLTKTLALEWAKYNVNVNVIVPGCTKGPKQTPKYFMDPENNKKLSTKIPFGRIGEPEDLAGAAVFLSSKASDWVTGHTLAVEGGRLISDYSGDPHLPKR